MKIRNRFWDRRKRPLVLPKYGRWESPIPTAEITVKVELIEEYRVLKRLMIGDLWCFIILDQHDDVRIISFDDDGREFDATLPDEIKYYRPGPHGYRQEYWNYDQ